MAADRPSAGPPSDRRPPARRGDSAMGHRRREFSDRPPRRDFRKLSRRWEIVRLVGISERADLRVEIGRLVGIAGRRGKISAEADRRVGIRPPRREFGDKPPRRDSGPPRRDFGGSRPPSGDRPPRKDFGDRPPRRNFGSSAPPRRDGGGPPPRRDSGGPPRGKGPGGAGSRPPSRPFRKRP